MLHVRAWQTSSMMYTYSVSSKPRDQRIRPDTKGAKSHKRSRHLKVLIELHYLKMKVDASKPSWWQRLSCSFLEHITYSQVRDFFMVKLFVYSDFGPATYCSSSLHPLQSAKRSFMSNKALHEPTHTCAIFNYIPASSLSRFSCLSFAYARGLVTEDFATILALGLDRFKFHRNCRRCRSKLSSMSSR